MVTVSDEASAEIEPTYSRRTILRTGAVVGGVALWSVPTVTVLSGKAFAANSAGSAGVRGEKFNRDPNRTSQGDLPFTGAGFPVERTVAVAAAAVAAGSVMTVAAKKARQNPDAEAATAPIEE